jgi:hypothetical protein
VEDNRKLLLSPEWKLAFEDRHVIKRELAIRQQLEKVSADEGAAKMAHTMGLLQGQLLMLEFLRGTLPKRVQREIEEEKRVEQSTSVSPVTASPEIL